MVCTWCCIRCRPRYKRHVDSIFPVDPKAGLVNVEMQKLTYYALTNPRKLDRIGNYLADYLRYYVDHRRNDFAAISMRAMEQLLQACRSANINLFVESFLRMVQKLLESPEPSLQILGSTSFVLFANIQEDTPSYHRRYDFFVTKFSSMSQGGGQGDENRRTRQAGLKGLQGVILKTVTDDTMVNIWDEIHLQKIMQALLFNIHRGFSSGKDGSAPMSPWDQGPGDQSSDIDPDQLARLVLQDLVSRAAYGHVKSLMKPLLHFIDHHRIWVPNNFPLHCMRLIMGSIRMQNSFIAVAQLLGHLDEHKDGAAKLRVSLVEVVSQSVTLSSAESITPTILEMFGSLLRHLKMSIATCNKAGAAPEDVREEGEFQEAIVQSVESFTRELQIYTKVEVCTYIIGAIPTNVMNVEDTQIERIFLQCIMKITESINSTVDPTTLPLLFPGSFLAPLQSMALSESPTTRAVIQQIFHTVLDRSGNRGKVSPNVELRDLSDEGIVFGAKKNQDVLFFKQRGQEIYFRVYEGLLKVDNNLDNYTRTFTSAVLWCIEIPSDEVLVELIHMVFGLQDEACSNPRSNVNIIHALVAAFLVFASRLSQNDALHQHVIEVNKRREKDRPHLLPTTALSTIIEGADNSEATSDVEEGLGPYMFDATVVAECLKQQGTNVERLSDPYHYKRAAAPRTPESTHSLKLALANDGIYASEIQTCPMEEVTYDSLKLALQNSHKLGPINGSKERLLNQESYEECMAKSAEKREKMIALRQQVFGNFRNGDISPTESTHSLIDLDNLNNLSIELPDMFVY